LFSSCINEEGRVTFVGDEPMRSDEGFQSLMPCSWGLTKPVNGLMKLANIVWMLTIFRAWWLSHKELFEKTTL